MGIIFCIIPHFDNLKQGYIYEIDNKNTKRGYLPRLPTLPPPREPRLPFFPPPGSKKRDNECAICNFMEYLHSLSQFLSIFKWKWIFSKENPLITSKNAQSHGELRLGRGAEGVVGRRKENPAGDPAGQL
jgi:hypothetical protein